MSDSTDARTSQRLRERLHEIIFEADTPAGKKFDVILLSVILLSVLVVMLDSVARLNAEFGEWLRWWDWLFTIAFTIEYLLRLYCVRRPLRYALSFFGLVDLMAVIKGGVNLDHFGGAKVDQLVKG